MHTGSVFPRFIQMGALGVCKLSHLLIFVFQAQIDLEILNFQHYNISIKMIPLCHSTQKHPAGAECLSPDLCSVIPLSRYRPERWKSSPSGGLLWRNPPCRSTATDQIPQSHRSVLSASRWNPRSVLTLRSFPISGGSLHQTAWFKDFRQFHDALRQIAY